MAVRKKENKNADPISERARLLNEQIASLEAEIKKIDSQLHTSASKPKLRSTAIPHGATIPRKTETPPPQTKPVASEPVFEEVKPITPRTERETSELFNEMGMRKYDLPALWNKLRHFFSGPSASNPRLVNYLAAGGVQGLRPLRYEKRVARNRFIALVIVLFIILLGIISLVVKYH